MDSRDSAVLDPPSAAHVARRALVLSAVTCRGHIESNQHDTSAQALHPRIISWLEACGLQETLEPEEEAIIFAPMGGLDRETQLEATRKTEGAAILAWALGKYPLPPHDIKVDPFRVAESLGFLWDEAAGFVRHAQVRGREQCQAYRELIRAIHQRLLEAEHCPQRNDLDGSIQPVWLRALGLTRASPVMEGDLAVGGEPLSRVEPATILAIEEISRERHRAASWLVGETHCYWKWTWEP